MGPCHPKRLLFAALLLLLVYVHIRHSQSNDFYTKTVQALEKKTQDKALKEEIDAKVQKILNGQQQPLVATSPSDTLPAVVAPSQSAPRLSSSLASSSTPSEDDTDRNNPPDRKRPENKLKYIKEPLKSPLSPSEPVQPADPPYHAQVRAALDEIIRYHGIVVFSKTYCPHSKRAKSLLLNSYDIVPKPYVVELDRLTEPADGGTAPPLADAPAQEDIPTMGKALQNLLAQRTRRNTVPNVMVLGRSIGGADEVLKLDEEGALAGKLKGMVGKRLEKCEKRRGVQAAL